MADTIDNINTGEQSGEQPHRRKKYRYKIRKKKKRSKKKRIRKLMEYLLWAVVIAAFIASLVILVKELDISDKKIKEKRRKSELMVPANNSSFLCKLQSGCIISHSQLT